MYGGSVYTVYDNIMYLIAIVEAVDENEKIFRNNIIIIE